MTLLAEMRPIADPPLQEVEEGSPARFRCWVPTHPDAQISWRTESGALPSGNFWVFLHLYSFYFRS
jgi:hypothetical protein